jgi:DNA-binding NarL/FixJ family response regulator
MDLIIRKRIHMLRIIIMDDDINALGLYKKAFSNAPHLLSYNKGRKSKRKQDFDEDDIEAFDITYCDSSIETVNHVKNSIENNNPFSIAFLDIRMKGQENGIKVGQKLRELDPDLELVFVTGFSGYNPKEIAALVPPIYKMIYIQKPFDILELLHLAYSLSHKWLHERSERNLKQRLHQLVEEKTKELKLANEVLEKKVEERTTHLEEANMALKVLLKQREEDKKKMGETIGRNIQQLVKPMVDKLRLTHISDRQENILSTLNTNLNEITNPFLKALDAAYLKLTPMEIQVANFVKTGLSNKEMAELMGISKGTVMIHRHNLRDKLGLKNKKVNLRTHLLSLDSV